MSDVYDFAAGNSPLVVSIPHDGRLLASGLAARMTDAGRGMPDTDWHVRKLYSFVAELDATVISARYSRYVVDLNRPPNDATLYENQLVTGLVPDRTFSGADLYHGNQAPDGTEREARVAQYWQPYHDRLAEALDTVRERFGYALLWDAHSIASVVPSLFDGVLPDLNVGTNGGASCAAALANAVATVAGESSYSTVVDVRFRGGYITRHYGMPGRGIHAVQLELAQRNYMDENDLRYDARTAGRLADTIRKMLQSFVAAAARNIGPGDTP